MKAFLYKISIESCEREKVLIHVVTNTVPSNEMEW